MKTAFAILLAFVPAQLATAQTLAPVVQASISDEPRDGIGDSLNPPRFGGLLAADDTLESRAIEEYDIRSLAGANIRRATLEGAGLKGLFDESPIPRVFELAIYAGNGQADLSNFEIPAQVIATVQYVPADVPSVSYQIDVTDAIETLLAGGSDYLGMRITATADHDRTTTFLFAWAALNVDLVGSLGASYCINELNSSGEVAQISASGSTSVSANDLVLHASTVPAGQIGYFFYGPGQQRLPFFDGWLCVHGGSAGLVRLPIVQANGAVLSHPLDNTSFTTPQTRILPGSAWNFQGIYRDPGATLEWNWTNGIEITFGP